MAPSLNQLNVPLLVDPLLVLDPQQMQIKDLGQQLSKHTQPLPVAYHGGKEAHFDPQLSGETLKFTIAGASGDLGLLLLFQTVHDDMSHQMVGFSRESASSLPVADTYLRL